MDLGGGVPREVTGGETARLDRNELYDLIEQCEGREAAQRMFAAGTPGGGFPQLVDEPEPQREPVLDEPARDTRARDVMLGGAISLAAMIAWYCATQL